MEQTIVLGERIKEIFPNDPDSDDVARAWKSPLISQMSMEPKKDDPVQYRNHLLNAT